MGNKAEKENETMNNEKESEDMGNKKKRLKMTFDDIIKAKIQKENDKLRVAAIEIPSVEKELIFKKPTDEMIFEYMDNLAEKEKYSTEVMVEEYVKMIYLSCETLQDPELHRELEVDDPFDTVKAFMDANDIMTVGEKVCSMNSLYKNMDEKAKN